ncbi:hypothetical protein [Streptomyces albireticuli]|uniref:Lipoprotein n=1 Tax=Streptomyces albireticuli TaxID=1940 RepID=A0A2A2D7J7_9ACTN|nr:hypothetical protein [Streptomyces albireticuli]MCD9140584.1 hypothetical protein [Streptomyces albireticuli]MCD9161454.1 hypothetical protein [Streptomyces albireticuli]MCD9192976.1 hypothetical protein [Streptomyces albireticuli]PAU47292.1 hypothetical protein CK936_19490 [Streptomyces albireticuli]
MRRLAIPLSVLGCMVIVGAGTCSCSAEFEDGSAQPSDLVGSWSGEQGARVTLREDGSVAAVKVPTAFSLESEKPTKWFTGSGTWELEKKPKLGDQQIGLTLGEVFGSKKWVRLRVAGKAAQGGLYVVISEDAAKTFPLKKSS